MKINYSSNNSGGSWWLSDQNWYDLEHEGWDVEWFAADPFYNGTSPIELLRRNKLNDEGRWLGALASHASKEFPSEEEAIAEWSRITGQYADDEGCDCCGPPHYFSTGS